MTDKAVFGNEKTEQRFQEMYKFVDQLVQKASVDYINNDKFIPKTSITLVDFKNSITYFYLYKEKNYGCVNIYGKTTYLYGKEMYFKLMFYIKTLIDSSGDYRVHIFISEDNRILGEFSSYF